DSCAWTASSQASWLHLTAGFSGTGAGAVSYSVEANPDASPRTGTITVAQQTFTLTQAGACHFTLRPATAQTFTALGGQGSLEVTTLSSCSWSATSNVSWLIFDPSLHSGQAKLNFTVLPNPDTTARSATLSLGTERLSVLQGAAFRDLSPSHPLYEF